MVKENTLELEISFSGGLKVEAQYGEHTIKTDQKVSAGGQGSAPEPYILFLASLGTCTGAYALGFCQAREIPYDNLRLRQKMTWDPESKRLAKIEMELVLPPEFPAKYDKAIARVAGMCAVKKTIMDPPAISLTSVRE